MNDDSRPTRGSGESGLLGGNARPDWMGRGACGCVVGWFSGEDRVSFEFSAMGMHEEVSRFGKRAPLYVLAT